MKHTEGPIQNDADKVTNRLNLNDEMDEVAQRMNQKERPPEDAIPKQAQREVVLNDEERSPHSGLYGTSEPS